MTGVGQAWGPPEAAVLAEAVPGGPVSPPSLPKTGQMQASPSHCLEASPSPGDIPGHRATLDAGMPGEGGCWPAVLLVKSRADARILSHQVACASVGPLGQEKGHAHFLAVPEAGRGQNVPLRPSHTGLGVEFPWARGGESEHRGACP